MNAAQISQSTMELPAGMNARTEQVKIDPDDFAFPFSQNHIEQKLTQREKRKAKEFALFNFLERKIQITIIHYQIILD